MNFFTDMIKDQKPYKVIDFGKKVYCDSCNGDYSDSDDEGGFLFGSHAYCPKCAKERLPKIKSYGEENYIKAYCPEGTSFKDFVLGLRGGDNTVKFYSIDKDDK